MDFVICNDFALALIVARLGDMRTVSFAFMPERGIRTIRRSKALALTGFFNFNLFALAFAGFNDLALFIEKTNQQFVRFTGSNRRVGFKKLRSSGPGAWQAGLSCPCVEPGPCRTSLALHAGATFEYAAECA